jgi:drug/metabolite transporter (DMT)-like permease
VNGPNARTAASPGDAASAANPGDDASATKPGDDARAWSPRDLAVGRWLVLGATLFWGTSATLARYVFRDHAVPPLTVVALRLGISAVLLGAWLAIRHPGRLRLSINDVPYFLVLGGVGLAGVQGSYYYTISVLGVGLAILLQYLAPALIVIVDIARGRRVGLRTGLAVIAALTGTGLLVGGVDPASMGRHPLAWATGFGSAILFAFYVVFSKRGLDRYAPETALFYSMCVAALVWGVVTPPWRIVAAGYSPGLWGLFLLLALSSTLIPFALFYAGLRRLPATQTGILATAEPVIAVVSAALFLGESLGFMQNVGAVMVLAASAMTSARNSTSPRRESPVRSASPRTPEDPRTEAP